MKSGYPKLVLHSPTDLRSEYNFIVVHGFNVDDEGANTTDQIIPDITNLFKHERVVEVDYGEFGLVSVMRDNTKVAAFINEQATFHLIRNVGVGHSNGCAILLDSARKGMEYELLILINPALPVNTIFPDTVKRVIVVHTHHDVPTNVARVCNWIPLLGLIVPDAWGAMGKYGALRNTHPINVEDYDKRVTNMNFTVALKGHSDIFSKFKRSIRREVLEYADHLLTNPL